jgi:tagaturonate epimerase-like protein
LTSQATRARIDEQEIAAVAECILRNVEGRPLSQDLRAQLARELDARRLAMLRAHARSLESDPQHPANYYLVFDTLESGRATSWLLQVAPASAAAAERFAHPVWAERIRASSNPASGGTEVKVFPFASSDHENIRIFAEQVSPAFLPRPQGAQPAVAAGNRHPEFSLPAVFDAYRAILETLKVNMASTVQLSATREMTTDEALASRDGEIPTAPGHTRVSIRHLYHAGLWAAIRAGWREGYTAEADHFIVSGSNAEQVRASVEAVKEAIRHAAGYTKFTTDTSRLFELESDPRHPRAWSDSAVQARFQQSFSDEERRWVLSEFSSSFPIEGASYKFAQDEVIRLAVKFGQSLKLNEELFDSIRAVKRDASFDFEPSLDEAETLTTAKELLFYMHWLKARGRPAQLVPPNLGFKKRQAYPVAMETTPRGGLGLVEYCHHKMWPELVPRVTAQFHSRPLEELAARVSELAAVALYFDGTLSIHSGSGKQPEVLECIGRATAGRVNYKISGELQLQLFDVLSQQPVGSPWRKLFERMVDRANRFAAAGAFGEESELADKYAKTGRKYYLGDSARGRVDGNLFLVFWLGNVVGSRDLDPPDGDRRFFKEKLDELPEDLLAEVRRRNSRYVVWLAQHLRAVTSGE